MNTTQRAAQALDLTYFCGECGPRTMKARSTVAAWLDGAISIRKSLVRAYCEYLEMVAAREAK
jgi:hypothetical protein